jgi:hypothetical protein
MIDLKQLANDRGLRTTLDESATIDPARSSRPWYWRVPCRYGFVSIHGPATLAAWTGNPKIVGKLVSIPGVRIHQRGDTEARVLFGPEILDSVVAVLQARKRRRISDSERERLASISPFLHSEAVSAAPSPV